MANKIKKQTHKNILKFYNLGNVKFDDKKDFRFHKVTKNNNTDKNFKDIKKFITKNPDDQKNDDMITKMNIYHKKFATKIYKKVYSYKVKNQKKGETEADRDVTIALNYLLKELMKIWKNLRNFIN